MDRKTYMREVYWKYWITAREKIYGFAEYDKCLCNSILQLCPAQGSLLEVAMGTGYPFLAFFLKRGYSVCGVDISPPLVEKCRRLYPDCSCQVGDAENLDYPDNHFDVTYCFHSTWYFPNLARAIDEMLRVTRQNGFIIFDIQNCNNSDVERNYQKRIRETRGIFRAERYIKNIAKIILRRGNPIWYFVVHEVPTYPEVIYQYLANRGLANYQVFAKKEDGTLGIQEEQKALKQFARLVFVVWK